MKRAIVDGDMLAYRVAFSCESETKWTDDLWTLFTSESAMKNEVYKFFDNLCDTLDVGRVIPVFSPKTNFRYELFPDYKANRKDKRKPLGLRWLIDWVLHEYAGLMAEGMEADDLIGIICTRAPDETIAVSGDKDFGTLPITWYNPLSEELVTTTPEEARNFHLVQTLAGDAADGYLGVRGTGVVTAKKLLDKKGYTWETVVSAYEKAGMDADDALLTGRLAYILHNKDYNAETKEISLWEPEL
tara:strand:+ start:889 stop:1620 length:732 start_codon:yes stop_codon:yes gene_type:complete